MSEQVDLRALQGSVIADRYCLDEFLDEGHFGGVFRGRQFAYGVPVRDVAIKVSKSPLTDAEARLRFGDAIPLAHLVESAPDATLREHFVMVYDAGRFPEPGILAGHAFVAMELVSGGSLKGILRGIRLLPLARANHYFEQLLRAVSFMHVGDGHTSRPAMVHRDLKPANVLVKRLEDGNSQRELLKVSDFGLAVHVDELLGTADSAGDLSCLPPEAFHSNAATPRGDVYALALIYYEMICGENPFSRPGSHLHDEPGEVRKIHARAREQQQFSGLNEHPELRRHPELVAVVERALRYDEQARFANAQEFLAAWQKAAEPPGGARSPRLATLPKPWDEVRELVARAERRLAEGEAAACDALLQQAVAINRDKTKVPDSMSVGEVYLASVRRLLARGDVGKARELAREGNERNQGRASIEAMALAYAGTPLGRQMTGKLESMG